MGPCEPALVQTCITQRSPSHYLWAVLIARIYEVFPLLCPICGGQMRLIAFVTERTQIMRILNHIGVDSEIRIFPRRAGHRCGMTVVMRRWMAGRKSRQQTGIWQRNPDRTTRSVRAPIGNQEKRCLELAAGQLCALHTWRTANPSCEQHILAVNRLGAARVSTWSESSSKGRYLASRG